MQPSGRLWRVLACLFLPFVLATGCRTTVEPFTGRSQFILTSPGDEARMGLQAWQQVVEKEKPATDRRQIAAVSRVGEALSQVIVEPGFDWEFRVFESDQANAFCLPGGKVAVYSGLFKYVANDAELAAVVGHEIGHAVARHGGERMTQALLQNVGAAGLSLALRNKSQQQKALWNAAYMGVTTVGVILPYSREHEYAADEIGLLYMALAGYDPQAALDFWAKFGADSKTPGLLEFLSTHPVGPKRLARLRELQSRAVLEYETAPVRRGFGELLGE